MYKKYSETVYNVFETAFKDICDKIFFKFINIG